MFPFSPRLSYIHSRRGLQLLLTLSISCLGYHRFRELHEEQGDLAPVSPVPSPSGNSIDQTVRPTAAHDASSHGLARTHSTTDAPGGSQSLSLLSFHVDDHEQHGYLPPAASLTSSHEIQDRRAHSFRVPNGEVARSNGILPPFGVHSYARKSSVHLLPYLFRSDSLTLSEILTHRGKSASMTLRTSPVP